jgi:hypothetical protein
MMESFSFPLKRHAPNLKRYAALLAVVVGFLGSQHAFACPAGEFNPVGGFLSAPLVLAGKITDNQPIAGTKSTLITLQVSERLIGKAPSEITLLWAGHPDGLTSPTWDGDPYVLIAAQPPRTGDTGRMTLGFEDVNPSLPAIIGGFCTPDRIISANDYWADEIRESIKRQRPWHHVLFWSLTSFWAFAVTITYGLRYLTGARYDAKMLAEIHQKQRSYAERVQRYAALRSNYKHLPPL